MPTKKVIIDRDKLEAIASAVREKIDSTEKLTADQIFEEISKYTIDATATSNDIREGVICYSKNTRIVGEVKDYTGAVEDITEPVD